MNQLPDEFLVTIKAEDFETTKFMDTSNCALATALKRIYPHASILVGGFNARIDHQRYDFYLPDGRPSDREIEFMYATTPKTDLDFILRLHKK